MKTKRTARTALAKNIESYRLEYGMKQTELAKRIGVSQGEISMYENGRAIPPLQKITLMCNLFECPVEKFIGFDR